MSNDESFNKALDLFIESLLKPDGELRSIARRENCIMELLTIRDKCLGHCRGLRKK